MPGTKSDKPAESKAQRPKPVGLVMLSHVNSTQCVNNCDCDCHCNSHCDCYCPK